MLRQVLNQQTDPVLVLILSDIAAVGIRMNPMATAWNQVRTLIQGRQAELRLCVRVTVSALLTLVIGQWLNVPLVLWAVLTAVIVTQTSVGRSLKATIDYFIGTLGGAIYAGAVAALIPHEGDWRCWGFWPSRSPRWCCWPPSIRASTWRRSPPSSWFWPPPSPIRRRSNRPSSASSRLRSGPSPACWFH